MLPHRMSSVLAGGAEVAEILVAVNEVGAEHAAEEHDFLGKEQPHAKAGGILLLLLGREVMQQGRVLVLRAWSTDRGWTSGQRDLLLLSGISPSSS